MTQYVVPMYESERGWGAKIDGYAGPFNSETAANTFVDRYNLKYNNESSTPDYYIKALKAVPYSNQKCDYRSSL